jgi:hypothetical protein
VNRSAFTAFILVALGLTLPMGCIASWPAASGSPVDGSAGDSSHDNGSSTGSGSGSGSGSTSHSASGSTRATSSGSDGGCPPCALGTATLGNCCLQ